MIVEVHKGSISQGRQNEQNALSECYLKPIFDRIL